MTGSELTPRHEKFRSPAILLLAGVGASLAAWCAQLIGIRAIGGVEATAFIAGWSAYFSITAAYAGLQQETTRALSVAPENSGVSVRTVALLTGAVGMAAGIATLALVNLGANPLISVLIGGAWVAAATQSAIVGGSVARRAIALATLAMVSDALLRLGLMAGAAALGHDSPVIMLSLAAVASLVTLAVLLPLGGGRILSVRMGPPRLAARRVAQASLAAVLAAMLITGAPLLVNTIGSMNGIEETRAMGLLSLTRAPVLLPIVALQSWLLSRFVGARHLTRSLLTAFGLVTIEALAAALLALFAGERVVMAVMGPTFAVPGRGLAALILSSSCLGYLFVVSLAALARDRHSVSVWLWALTLGLTLGTLPLIGSSLGGVAWALALPALVVSVGGAFVLSGAQPSARSTGTSPPTIPSSSPRQD